MCESRVEVETPYWAVNSEGSVRAVLNNEEFEQAVHKEICTYVTYHSTDMQAVSDSVVQYSGKAHIQAPCFRESFVSSATQ